MSAGAGFLKKKKQTQNNNNHQVISKPALKQIPKLESISLLQKAESKSQNTNKNLAKVQSKTSTKIQTQAQAKIQAKQDAMAAMDKIAIGMANPISQNPNDPAPLDLNIGEGPVWVSGWVRYFKYFPSMKTNQLTPQTTPRQFMINSQYREQFKINPNWESQRDLKSKDDLDNDLDVYITENNKFYAKLVRNQILILSSREVNKKFFYSIKINIYRQTPLKLLKK